MAPKIGISAQAFDSWNWYKEVKDSGFDVLEINGKSSRVYLNLEWLKERIIPNLKGLDLSMHSQTNGIFMAPEQFMKMDIEVFKTEVLVCEIMDINELVFHLKFQGFKGDWKKVLKELLDFAKEHGVEPLYESNGHFDGRQTIEVLEAFPELKYNLDFGHLNRGIFMKTVGYGLDEFLEKVRDRTIYLHVHNNNGEKDQHYSLDAGTLDWKHVLDMLDMSKIKKIIVEIPDLEQAKKTKEQLDEYFKGK